MSKVSYLSRAHLKDLQGTALVRLDFNAQDDAWRIRAAIPTVRLLAEAAQKVIVVSHRGRPAPIKIVRGKPQGFNPSLSLRRDRAILERFLGRKVIFVPYFAFPKIRDAVRRAPPHSVLLLENMRMFPGEKTNDRAFAKNLASLADFYVNNAFANSHRAHASMSAVAKFLPSYAGLELEREIESLSQVMKHPKHPLVFLLGGSKARYKLGMLRYFSRTASWFLLGGGAANTLFRLKKIDIKQSLVENSPEHEKELKKFLHSKKVILPIDYQWHKDRIVDIGPRNVRLFRQKIAGARTIVWSGPMGWIEHKTFDRGNKEIAEAVAANRHAFSLTGGGETVPVLQKHRLEGKFSFISTGGGAMLDFLAGKKLPGIEALKR